MSAEEFDWSFPLDRSRSSVQEAAVLESLARRARPGERPEELLFDLGLLDEHVLIGDSLKLASAFLDPELCYLERRFSNLSVDIGIAPRSEILEALNRVTELL